MGSWSKRDKAFSALSCCAAVGPKFCPAPGPVTCLSSSPHPGLTRVQDSAPGTFVDLHRLPPTESFSQGRQGSHNRLSFARKTSAAPYAVQKQVPAPPMGFLAWLLSSSGLSLFENEPDSGWAWKFILSPLTCCCHVPIDFQSCGWCDPHSPSVGLVEPRHFLLISRVPGSLHIKATAPEAHCMSHGVGADVPIS